MYVRDPRHESLKGPWACLGILGASEWIVPGIIVFFQTCRDILVILLQNLKHRSAIQKSLPCVSRLKHQ